MRGQMKPGRDPCSVVLPAAGQGRRFGSGLSKQYRSLDDSAPPVVVQTIRRLHAHPLVDAIQPVIGADDGNLWDAMDPLFKGLHKLRPPVAGGAERQASVKNGLEALGLDPRAWVAIHDGVRPILPRQLLDALFAARSGADALIPALPSVDTLKRVDESGHITATVDRRPIWRAQTPQIFRYGLILEAHRQAASQGYQGTDDAALLEWQGIPVRVVLGDERNIKITRPEDMALAGLYLKGLDT